MSIMREIKTWRDPYDAGFSTCKPRKINIESGVTVLVGCNGAGKTTLLHNIAEVLEEEQVPFVKFDNMHDGGHRGLGSAAFNDNFGLMVAMMSSSEGENISLNIGVWSTGIRNFIVEGRYSRGSREESLVDVFRSTSKELAAKNRWLKSHKERWFLIDAADSGYSIDNVLELKEILDLIKIDCTAANKEPYIIISANEYELANGENCFDVNSGKYITFKDYEDYKKFIVKSRKLKDKRYERIAQKGQS